MKEIIDTIGKWLLIGAGIVIGLYILKYVLFALLFWFILVI